MIHMLNDCEHRKQSKNGENTSFKKELPSYSLSNLKSFKCECFKRFEFVFEFFETQTFLQRLPHSWPIGSKVALNFPR